MMAGVRQRRMPQLNSARSDRRRALGDPVAIQGNLAFDLPGDPEQQDPKGGTGAHRAYLPIGFVHLLDLDREQEQVARAMGKPRTELSQATDLEDDQREPD